MKPNYLVFREYVKVNTASDILHGVYSGPLTQGELSLLKEAGEFLSELSRSLSDRIHFEEG